MKCSGKARARRLLSHVLQNMHFAVFLILFVLFFVSFCLVVLKLTWTFSAMIIRKPPEISANPRKARSQSRLPIFLERVDQSRE